MKKGISSIFLIIVMLLVALIYLVYYLARVKQVDPPPPADTIPGEPDINIEIKASELHPLAIEAMEKQQYQGGDFSFEKTLSDGAGYHQYIVSYLSEGLKIFGLLTVPRSERPEKGYPAVLFIHGYIPPAEYSTTGSYPTYQAKLAAAGFITFKPDLRGHGNSEGEAVSAHFSDKYVIDTLNALAYLKQYEEADPQRIGYWGHSNGGEIDLRAIILSDDIKAASLWAGVVGSPEDMLETYNQKIPFLQDISQEEGVEIIAQQGLPSQNPEFWSKLDPYQYLEKIEARVDLHHGTADVSVPVELSRHLEQALEEAGKNVVYHEYPGDDHNISRNANLAWERTIQFFRENL